MSIAQLAKVIGKVAKSPMGKLGMAAVASGTMISIFSGCKKDRPEVCMCMHTDVKAKLYEHFISQLSGDSFGLLAFDQYFKENYGYGGSDYSDCCGSINLPSDPDFPKKCQEWIDNYLAGNDDCEGE